MQGKNRYKVRIVLHKGGILRVQKKEKERKEKERNFMGLRSLFSDDSIVSYLYTCTDFEFAYLENIVTSENVQNMENETT